MVHRATSVLYCRTIQIRRDTRWPDGCEAAGVTARVVVCNAWFGGMVLFLFIEGLNDNSAKMRLACEATNSLNYTFARFSFFSGVRIGNNNSISFMCICDSQLPAGLVFDIR
ncbi:hypothetical protein RAHE111665_00045 [Rariglobus hedericola]